VTNQKLFQEEIKRRLNSDNICYHSVQNLLSSRLLSKNVKVRIYKLLREEHKLRVFENSVPRRIFGPKRGGLMGGWRKLYNEELRDLYSSPSIIKNYQVEEDEVGGTCGTNGGEEERV
jgi:hypothetical protein